MKKITVYGPGCAKCHKAEANVRQVLAETGLCPGDRQCFGGEGSGRGRTRRRSMESMKYAAAHRGVSTLNA